jgi:hypothetical protein
MMQIRCETLKALAIFLGGTAASGAHSHRRAFHEMTAPTRQARMGRWCQSFWCLL